MLNTKNTGLIVVDIQGKLARLVHDSDALISNCAKLIKGVQSLDLPIIWLEQNPNKLGSTVDELSSLLQSGYNPLSTSQKAIQKFSFDACEEPLFMQTIQATKVKTWLVCGIEAHICVYQTALNLKHNGFDVQLVIDCVSSRTLENKNLAVNKLLNNGIESTGLEMCLFELIKDCRAPAFKKILRLIK